MMGTLRLNWVILRTSIEARLVYRGDFAFATLVRFLPIVTQIFLWFAIFEAVKASQGGSQTIVGYSYEDMVAYYGMIENIDDNFGRLQEFLKKQKLEENTILVFSSDNGPVIGVRR